MTDKELEIILSNYKHLLKSLEDERFSILHPYLITDTNIGGGTSGRISNPTESVAMALMESNENELQRHVKAIQFTYSKMPVDQKRMMEVYYFERSYGMSVGATANRLNTDKSTLYRWRKNVCLELRKQLKV